jgi:hypothetical protein
MTTPTARSMTLPFMANSLNSDAKLMGRSPLFRFVGHRSDAGLQAA